MGRKNRSDRSLQAAKPSGVRFVWAETGCARQVVVLIFSMQSWQHFGRLTLTEGEMAAPKKFNKSGDFLLLLLRWVLSGQFPATSRTSGTGSELGRVAASGGFKLDTTFRSVVTLVGQKIRRKVAEKPAKLKNIKGYCCRQASTAATSGGNRLGMTLGRWWL